MRRLPPSGALRARGPSLALVVLTAACTSWAEPVRAAPRVPSGVGNASYAAGVPQPTNLAFDPAGRLWISSAGNFAAPGDGVWMVPQAGTRPRRVIGRLYSALGVAWHHGQLYVAHAVPYRTEGAHHGRVTAFGGFDGRRFRRRRVVVGGLPVGEHSADSIVPGPDGRLYLGLGTKHDATAGSRLSGTVLSFDPHGGRPRVEARGLRNPYGLAFLPGTTTLLVSDNGRDDLGPSRPPDELNSLDVAGPAPFFGFPRCWGRRGGSCRGARAPVAELAPHAAAGVVVATSAWGDYGPSAFVTEFGSSHRRRPTGADLIRVPLAADGLTATGSAARFAYGFEQYDPLGLVLGPDGALYLSRWLSGDVLRISPPPAAPAASRG